MEFKTRSSGNRRRLCYDREFLLSLRKHPLSLRKPKLLVNISCARNRPLRNTYPEQQNSKTKYECTWREKQEPMRARVRVIIIPHTVEQKGKLQKAENAWKPSVKQETSNDEKAQTEEVVKTVKGILNKLTPENFEKLVDKVKSLPIDTLERLTAVTDLVFEKAVIEHCFSSTYAEMCCVLSVMSIRGKDAVSFRKLIIRKCRKEFEKDLSVQLQSKKKEIEACTEPDKKRELSDTYNREELKMRKRAVGNIKFIGELFKLRLFEAPLMMIITRTLLQRCDEESLECLCKLLTTIGEMFEGQCAKLPNGIPELDQHFGHIKKIVDSRLTNSRIRCLMMDVIDLRKNKWVPRRELMKPKTKQEIQEDIRREQMVKEMESVSIWEGRNRRQRKRK